MLVAERVQHARPHDGEARRGHLLGIELAQVDAVVGDVGHEAHVMPLVHGVVQGHMEVAVDSLHDQPVRVAFLLGLQGG